MMDLSWSSEFKASADATGGDGHQEARGRVELVEFEFGAQEDILHQRNVDAAADGEAVQHLASSRLKPLLIGADPHGLLTVHTPTVPEVYCTATPVTETFVFATPIANPIKP